MRQWHQGAAADRARRSGSGGRGRARSGACSCHRAGAATATPSHTEDESRHARPRTTTTPTGAGMTDKAVSRLSMPASFASGPSSASSRTHSRRPSLAAVGPSKRRTHLPNHACRYTRHVAHLCQYPAIGRGAARRLLMPTVRSAKPTMGSPKIPPYKASPSKMSRSRAGSVSNPSFLSDQSDKSATAAMPDWIGGGRRFEIVEEQIELAGYQIYAVEKWVVERRRPVIVLTVFTGDPQHKILVTALSPSSSLSPSEAQTEWDQALRHLRSEGARPKDIGLGTLMVTSLANFRSDYTIVHIPRGNFLEVREQLYTNINLLRMGCSGRSALTLEEPSDTTKDRFILMYHIPDKGNARSAACFNATVLELVKLTQAGLAMFELFDTSPEERNGLLCDVTCDGIRRWAAEVGEPCMKIEPTERVADPTVLSALFSLILTTRNKLHALGYYVPKDPFLDPGNFTRALTAFQSPQRHGHGYSHSISSPRTSSPPRATSPHKAHHGSIAPSTVPSPTPPVAYLSQALVEAVQAAYDKKMRPTESYKVHRVLISKLDDLVDDLRSAADGEGAPPGQGASGVNPTADLGALVRLVVASSAKDAPSSLRYLWTGRPDDVGKKRREKEAVWSDGEREREEKEVEKDTKENREREKDGTEIETSREDKDREKEREERERDVRSSGDESESYKPVRRVQRKIESWAALGRAKKLSVDFGNLGKNRGGQSEQSGPSSTVPSVRITGDPDDEEPLSSGQASPSNAVPTMLGIGSYTPAQRSASQLSEYDRRVTEFNRKRPSTRPHYQSRIISWSDPLSAKELVDSISSDEREPHLSTLRRTDSIEDDETEVTASDTEMDTARRRRTLTFGPRRCRSFDAAADMADTRVLPLERMRVDVELCGQLLVMYRREQHLVNIAACLAALTERLSRTNTHLRTDHERARPGLAELRERAGLLHQVEAARARADVLTQETQALAYESAQYLVEDLWHMAVQPRRRVFALREKTFGTGRKHPQGVRGAHGRFNRVQWTLDGRERLVDALGRTESEAEEEEGLPGADAIDMEESEDEVDAVQHQSLRPTWLLNFFNYWGSKWGAAGQKKESTPPKEDEVQSDREDASEELQTTSDASCGKTTKTTAA
ncbi:uncharacterized protein B0H18DRAFT_1099992 [Fomitopsis serialis]|uniref:uncharacterized protein n=1 Tax=Fomitopsis serialis TaxID=139415 RepID=UPI002007922C|nr:uncharacterized protein B0H18DRAFT_1099992 [Neoantrodia serialis]KAH9938141.1 hypothetical protein B0H18DRAFT_1099992 [Neoantrodia serialis]